MRWFAYEARSRNQGCDRLQVAMGFKLRWAANRNSRSDGTRRVNVACAKVLCPGCEFLQAGADGLLRPRHRDAPPRFAVLPRAARQSVPRGAPFAGCKFAVWQNAAWGLSERRLGRPWNWEGHRAARLWARFRDGRAGRGWRMGRLTPGKIRRYC